MKVPEPRKLKSGNWFIQLRLGGVSVPVTAATATECRRQAELIKAAHRADKNPIQKAADKTLSQAIDDYISGKSHTLSPSTIMGYRTIQRSYLPKHMNKKLKDIKDWQQAINNEAKVRSPKTVKNTWRFVCSVLRENGITPPKIALPQLVENDRPWLEPEQITQFVSAIKGQPHEIPALLALHSLRRSEIIALTWDKIDLARGTIRIAGAVVPDESFQLVYKATNKNTASTRTIPIMIPALKTALEQVENKSGLLITDHPDTIRKRINRTCAAEGLPLVGVHGLRHSFASLAYHLGWSEQQTMEIGGWSDTKTMHKIYTHLAAADRLKAQNTMAAFYESC